MLEKLSFQETLLRLKSPIIMWALRLFFEATLPASVLRLGEVSGVKPFECEQCDQKFNVNGNLTTHILTHQDLKKQKCDSVTINVTLVSTKRSSDISH